MRVLWLPPAWDVYVGLQRSDPDLVVKINELIGNVRREPHSRAQLKKPGTLLPSTSHSITNRSSFFT
jgi:Txe/YoeB family toxin of Txe-Axe toxin-antitoxin module